MFKNNPDLFPTPEHLIRRMLSKVDFRNQKIKNILEPSAGLGHIIDYINKDINDNLDIPSSIFNCNSLLTSSILLSSF